MQLLIANKNYSSWSMRPWLVLKAFDLPFEEVMIAFSAQPHGGEFKQKVLSINPNGKVPVLLDDGQMIWDSLAICEYLAEKFPQLPLWPAEMALRIRARCISAEMHSGFMCLRSQCGMNIRADFKVLGAKLWAEDEGLRNDVAQSSRGFAAARRGVSCAAMADLFDTLPEEAPRPAPGPASLPWPTCGRRWAFSPARATMNIIGIRTAGWLISKISGLNF